MWSVLRKNEKLLSLFVVPSPAIDFVAETIRRSRYSTQLAVRLEHTIRYDTIRVLDYSYIRVRVLYEYVYNYNGQEEERARTSISAYPL